MKDLSIFCALALLALCSGCVSLERGYPDKRYFVLEAAGQANPANPSGNDTLRGVKCARLAEIR